MSESSILTNPDCVDRIVDYQTPEADKSILLSHETDIQTYRVYYLKHLRDEWEWVDDSKQGTPFVMLKRR